MGIRRWPSPNVPPPHVGISERRVPAPCSPTKDIRSSDVLSSRRPRMGRPGATWRLEPGRDDEAWLDINNRAFAGHPEQSAWTLEDLHERTTAEWFDPEAFL